MGVSNFLWRWNLVVLCATLALPAADIILYFMRSSAQVVVLPVMIISWLLAGALVFLFGVIGIRNHGYRALMPAALFALLVFFFAFSKPLATLDDALTWIDFRYYKKEREKVIEAIRTGKLVPNDSMAGNNVIRVPARYGNLSANCNRITFEYGPAQTLSVEFYTSDRTFDLFVKSFHYTELPGEMRRLEECAARNQAIHVFPVKKYSDFWYRSDVKHGYRNE